MLKVIRDIIFERLDVIKWPSYPTTWRYRHPGPANPVSDRPDYPIIVIASQLPENFMRIAFKPDHIEVMGCAGLGKFYEIVEYCHPDMLQAVENTVRDLATKIGLL